MPFRREPARYQPLGDWLAARPERRVTLPFTAVEAIIGHRLPPSARSGVGWWQHSDQRLYGAGRAWRAAGWRVAAVDRWRQTVTFERLP